MSFVRTVKRESPFVQLDKEYIGNGRLSLKATGLLTYFLSKPDGWQIRLEDVKKRFNDKDTSISTGVKELIATGYINRDRERRDNGTFGDWIYEVYERPEFNVKYMNGEPKRDFQVQVKPKPDFPIQEKPSQEKPSQENQGYSNNDFSNNDFSNKKEEEEEEVMLLDLVSFYEKNISKTGKAVVTTKLSEWLKLLPYHVIKKELENCSLYGAKSWNYVESTLKEDHRLNITTLEQLETKYQRHTEKTQKKKPVVNKGGKVTPIRKELLPDWYDQEQSEVILTQEQKEINAKRKAEVLAKIEEIKAKRVIQR